MKTKLHYIIMLFCLIVSAGCSDDYDDSKLWDSINGLENRVAKLEELCKQMNTNISSLQEIVTALQKNESIKSVATLPDGSGYLITFSSGKTITIYHGNNGEDGKDGYNGTDGVTPTISVRKDTDGIYYWTVNNDWLLVDGKKVKAEGTDGIDGEPGKDGEDGTNGKDGITPQFKITDGYWYISYDNELSWTKLGKATGDSGLNGSDGDNFFKGVSIEDGYVCFTLNDTDSTVIKLPFVSESELTVEVKEPGTLNSLLTLEQKRSLINIKVIGEINKADIRTIDNMNMIEIVDLSNAIYSEGTSISTMFNLNPMDEPANGNKTLRKFISFKNVKSYESSFSGCRNLEELIITADSCGYELSLKLRYCYNRKTIKFLEGITYIPSQSCDFPQIILPKSTQKVSKYAFSYNNMYGGDIMDIDTVICLATIPPKIWGDSSGNNYEANSFYQYTVDNITLKVPKESLNNYKIAAGWKDFKTILPLEE